MVDAQHRQPKYRYKAFISYSHAADGRLAPTLHSALHRFRKPWYQMRRMRVFRDKTGLSATPQLWPTIEFALGQSEYFLLLASPQAAASRWVQQEVSWWLKHRSVETLFIVLTEGHLQWDEVAMGFDSGRTDALPQDLHQRFPAEPLHVDLRWARTDDNLSLRHAQFRTAVLDLVVPLSGIAKDELDGDDVRQHRRTRRVAWAAVALIVAGACVAGWQWYVAEGRLRIALSRQLASQALLNSVQEPDLALLLAVEASATLDTTESRRALFSVLREHDSLRGYLGRSDHEVNAMALSADGRLGASGGCSKVNEKDGCDEGEVLLWDTERQVARGHFLHKATARC
jgi:TIR domain